MKFLKGIPVKEIAEKVGATIIGDDNLIATGLNEIHKVTPGDITFVDVKKYFDVSLKSKASIIILNEPTECPEGKALLLCEKPFEAYNGLAQDFHPFPPLTASISESAEIHPSTIIEPNVVVGHHVKIGKNCHIHANVTIAGDSIIGDNVIIQSGAMIGTDAFYFKRQPDGYDKWHSCGRVVLEDNVQIGANCTINKGVSGDTVIGAGSKLDCLVHIGHGAVIGKNCLVAGQVGVGGKTIVGDGVVLYGQAGIAHNLHIGDNAVVSAKAGVSKDLEAGKAYFGIPAQEARAAYRELAASRRLPDFFKEYYAKHK